MSARLVHCRTQQVTAFDIIVGWMIGASYHRPWIRCGEALYDCQLIRSDLTTFPRSLWSERSGILCQLRCLIDINRDKFCPFFASMWSISGQVPTTVLNRLSMSRSPPLTQPRDYEYLLHHSKILEQSMVLKTWAESWLKRTNWMSLWVRNTVNVALSRKCDTSQGFRH